MESVLSFFYNSTFLQIHVSMHHFLRNRKNSTQIVIIFIALSSSQRQNSKINGLCFLNFLIWAIDTEIYVKNSFWGPVEWVGDQLTGWGVGCTKNPKSFQNLMASWYILYQHGYRPFLQKKWFFLHFPHLATMLKVLKGKWGKISKNQFLAIKPCRNMLQPSC